MAGVGRKDESLGWTKMREGQPVTDDRRQAESLDFSGRPLAHVQPGQVLVSAEPRSFVTILGSCVTVCVYDPARRMGGLNHFLLPEAGVGVLSTRYGRGAMRKLIEKMLAQGAVKERLVAKVFGGACLLPNNQAVGDHLGGRNVKLAFSVLDEAGIPVVADDVRGTRGRKLIFHSDTGDTWVRRL